MSPLCSSSRRRAPVSLSPGPTLCAALALAALALAVPPHALAEPANASTAAPAPAPAPVAAPVIAPSLAPADATDLVTRPLRPRRGHLWLAVGFEIDFSHSQGGSRALAPDLTWGLTDDLSLALAHSARSIARIDHPGGLCLEACDHRPAYTAGALVQRRIVGSSAGTSAAPGAAPGLQLDALAGLLLRDTDPWKPAALLGVTGRWQRGRFALESEPYLQLGLANRDLGNRHRLVVPLRALVQPTCRWALGLHTGINGELAVFADAYHVPLAAVLRTAITPWLFASVEGGLASLGGPQNNSRRRFAAITIETHL